MVRRFDRHALPRSPTHDHPGSRRPVGLWQRPGPCRRLGRGPACSVSGACRSALEMGWRQANRSRWSRRQDDGSLDPLRDGASAGRRVPTFPMSFRKAPRFLVLTIVYTGDRQPVVPPVVPAVRGTGAAALLAGYLEIAPAFTLLSLLAFFLAGLYHGLWRYASTVTLFQIFMGATLSAMTLVVPAVPRARPQFPTSVIALVWMAELLLVGGVRFAWRLMRERVLGPFSGHAVPTLVIGADPRRRGLVQEMRGASRARNRSCPSASSTTTSA